MHSIGGARSRTHDEYWLSSRIIYYARVCRLHSRLFVPTYVLLLYRVGFRVIIYNVCINLGPVHTFDCASFSPPPHTCVPLRSGGGDACRPVFLYRRPASPTGHIYHPGASPKETCPKTPPLVYRSRESLPNTTFHATRILV